MKVIAVVNPKGGVGKTTTATTIAGLFHQRGKKTLLIDTDSQKNSTSVYRAKVEGVATLFDVLLEEDEDRCNIKEAIQHTELGDIVASDPLLRNADKCLAGEYDEYTRLKQCIEKVEDDYDYVVIDTNPTFNHLLRNALVAADELVVPMEADKFSVDGIKAIENEIIKLKKGPNQKIKIVAYVVTKYKAGWASKQYLNMIKKHATDTDAEVFVIKYSTVVANAQANNQHIFVEGPKSNPTIEYNMIVDYLLERGK